MKRLTLVVLPVLVALFFIHAAPASAEPDMREGQWEITSVAKMPGMPANMQNQQFVFSQCLTKEDMVPHGGTQPGADPRCKMLDQEISGNTVAWTMQCDTDGGKTTTKGRLTYSGDSFEGDIETVMPQMTINQHMTGRRTGDCTQ